MSVFRTASRNLDQLMCHKQLDTTLQNTVQNPFLLCPRFWSVELLGFFVCCCLSTVTLPRCDVSCALSLVGCSRHSFFSSTMHSLFCSRIGFDYGPTVQWCLLRGNRYRPGTEIPERCWTCGVLESAELYCRNQRSICAAAAQ